MNQRFPLHNQPVLSISATKHSQLKESALANRNAAHRRMNDRTANCPLCKRVMSKQKAQ